MGKVICINIDDKLYGLNIKWNGFNFGKEMGFIFGLYSYYYWW